MSNLRKQLVRKMIFASGKKRESRRIAKLPFLVVAVLLCVSQTASAESFDHPNGNFRVIFNDNDFSHRDAVDLANALEQARAFYSSAGFPVPQRRIRVKLRARRGDNLGAFNPLTGNIRIVVPVDRNGTPTGGNNTRERRRFTAAHELFHAVQFEALPSHEKIGLGLIWLDAKAGLMQVDRMAEFWLNFEGLAESMAWMVFPDAGAAPGSDERGHGAFWYAPPRFTKIRCAAYPFVFVDPWRITPSCTPTTSFEAVSYYTVPFWLGIGQYLATPSFDRTEPLRDVFQRGLATLHLGGINSLLQSAGMTRNDIRDRLSLSAGVERFGDETPRRAGDHWSAIYRDLERPGVDPENQAGPEFPSWAIDADLAPPNFEPGNTIRRTPLTPYLTPVPAAPVDGQLFAFNFAGNRIPTDSGGLPTFAGTAQGRDGPKNHPLDTEVVPPVTIQLWDDSGDPSAVVHPLVIAGFRTPGRTLFAPRMTEILPGDNPNILALNNFQLRDLSVLKVVPRSPGLRYQYGFLNELRTALGYHLTLRTRLEAGQWLVREVKRPTPDLFSTSAVVMLTPTTVPVGPTGPWMDSDNYDIVARAENTLTGVWSNLGAAQVETHIGQVALPSFLGNQRVRVDIARFAPGDHGGGRFFLTAATRGKNDPPSPDLLVRAHTTAFSLDSVDAQGCRPSATISVYVTNQGDADALDVNVRIIGDLESSGVLVPASVKRFDRSKTLDGVIAPGETRRRIFRVNATDVAPNAAIRGDIIVDPANAVAEYVEANNEAPISPVDVDCGAKTISADAELTFLTEQPAALPLLEAALPERSAYFAARVRPVLDWLRGRAARPDAENDPHFGLLLDQLGLLRDAGLFHPDVAVFLATRRTWSDDLQDSQPRAARDLRRRADLWLEAGKRAKRPPMTSYPGVLRATPAGLFVRDGDRILAAEPSGAWALLGFAEDIPLSDIILDGEELDFDTADGLLPILIGRHEVRIRGETNESTHVWKIDIGEGERRILSIR